MGMANLNRVYLRFPYPFWQADNYTFGFLPEFASKNTEWLTTPVFSMAVIPEYERRPGTQGVLIFMVGGDSAKALAE
jgi:hypothetical protein